MKFGDTLDTYLRARFSLIVISTIEEPRAIDAIADVCRSTSKECYVWDLSAGFKVIVGSQVVEGADPITALAAISKANDKPAVFILKDFHEFWKDPRVKRTLRNVAQDLRQTRKSIVVVTPATDLPRELQDEGVQMDFALPNVNEISSVLDVLAKTPGLRVDLTQAGREKLVQAAVGLSHLQAQRAFSQAIVGNGILDDRDIDVVTAEKKMIIRDSEALEFFTATEHPDDVGGLEVLKNWLKMRERAFTDEARTYGLPSPKGVALIGIPGTGKSLTAKMISSAWRLPLLRLDVGSLFGSLVGESEERVRKALRLAEAIAPCVMWIDELEKSLAQGGLDGGTSQRVFGAILTWMQDKNAPVFVVATANDVSLLPPELLRRGRFDEVFFLDLPTQDERREIFSVHLGKRKRIPEEYQLDRLASESAGYVGAEIEQAVIDAMYIAFNDGPREFTTDDISRSIARLVPLSRSQRESIENLRNWLREGRAQSASYQEVADASSHFVPLEIPKPGP
jgi:AAA+ superfamily predicted ATPase